MEMLFEYSKDRSSQNARVEKLKKDLTKCAGFIFEDNILLCLQRKKRWTMCNFSKIATRSCPVSTGRVSSSEVSKLNSPTHLHYEPRSTKLFSANAANILRASLEGPVENYFSLSTKSLNSRMSHKVSSLYFIWSHMKKKSTKCPADSGERGYRADTSCTVEVNRRRCIVLPLVRDGDDGTTRENSSSIFHSSSPNWEIASSHRWTIVVPRNPQFSIPPSHFQSFYSSWASSRENAKYKTFKQI